MRRHGRRESLTETTRKKLREETKRIASASNPADYARTRWDAVRRAKWFWKVIDALRSMAGSGEPCMYCDSNESAEVEHFKPKASFPQSAFDWDNFLWVCGICNRHKGDQYPPHTQPGAEILNPLEVDPWEYLFIEELTGVLCGVWRAQTGSPDERAESTISIVNLNREALQERRRQRVNEFKRFATEAVRQIDAGVTSSEDIVGMIEEFKASANQPDVAEYFLDGPGKEVEPFRSLFEAIG